MLRALTAFLMGLALVLTLTWPLELRDRPTRRSPISERKAFAARLSLHTGGIVVCLVGAGVGALLISRQAKREYRNAAMRNLRTLVEGEEPSEKG